MSRVFVACAKDGWEPSVSVVRYLQRKARKMGLISDWPTIAVLESHDLLLDCSHVTGDCGADLVARKKNGRWAFFTDNYEPIGRQP